MLIMNHFARCSEVSLCLSHRNPIPYWRKLGQLIFIGFFWDQFFTSQIICHRPRQMVITHKSLPIKQGVFCRVIIKNYCCPNKGASRWLVTSLQIRIKSLDVGEQLIIHFPCQSHQTHSESLLAINSSLQTLCAGSVPYNQQSVTFSHQ